MCRFVNTFLKKIEQKSGCVLFLGHIRYFFIYKITAPTIKAACAIIMQGMPIINRLCLVLWRYFFIDAYMATEPPNADTINRVFSGMRQEPFLARLLST